MRTITNILEMQTESDRLRAGGRRVAIVPTMGYLHRGHTSLIQRAKQDADAVVTTLFVNPTQFGPNEDFAKYPRDFERDTALAAQAGTDILFVPNVDDVYPKDFRAYVDVQGSSDRFEGAIRPGHFRGVATIVTKLFAIVRPHVAVFGQKDAQQAWLIRRLNTDLNFGIHIIVAPTIREDDGLAMSSRNTYLGPEERTHASVLYQSLMHAQTCIRNGRRDAAALIEEMRAMIAKGQPSGIDYVALIDRETFEPAVRIESPGVLAILAVRFGTTRLIDNLFIEIS